MTLSRTAREPDLATFRAAFSQLPSGVSIVSVPYGDTVVGITVSSLSSLSADPPLLMFNVDRRARSHDLLVEAGCFGVNVLAEDQSSISDHCARRGSSKDIAHLCMDASTTSSPALADVAVHFDCTLEAVHPGGDHSIFVGRIHRIVLRDDIDPLVYCGGRYRRTERFPSSDAQPAVGQWANIGDFHDWTFW
ncbi:flavin reductase family protein [Mycolicibacterium chlorophenolicum]|nr:flavin reductase family protein [Mycolicibacterium chlorophenolicum]